jgi:SPP1 family holin
MTLTTNKEDLSMDKKIDVNLIVRTIVSIIALINFIAAQRGFNPLNIDEQSIYVVVSTIVAIITWAWGFWKNNNFTDAAKQGQELIDKLKAEKKENKG